MKAAILGGGLIGRGWARLLERHGHSFRLFDERPERCMGATSVREAAADADIVLEAVAERTDEKRAVLAEAGRWAPRQALIASASSGILPSVLQAGVDHSERVLVIHPLHPVDLLPVIEVVPGAQTAPDAVERGAAFVRSLGKIPVVLRREVPGYVVNRLAAALWREAVNLVLQGVVDVPELDTAASLGPCLGWAVQGPFLTYELAAESGLGPFMEHLGPSFGEIWRSLASWDSVPPADLTRLAAAAHRAYGGRPRHELEQERDAILLRLLQALGEHGSSRRD